MGSAWRRICIFCKQTSPKRWFGNVNTTSNCDVTNSAHQIQMTTICHWTKTSPWKISAYATDQEVKHLNQRSSIHFEARTPSGKKNHFCTPCTIWCIVFCILRPTDPVVLENLAQNTRPRETQCKTSCAKRFTKLTFILYFTRQGPRGCGPIKTIYPKANSQYHQP